MTWWPVHGRWFVFLLCILLSARLAASVWSTSGLHWDFANYYGTAQGVIRGDFENLYRMPRSTMQRFYESIGEASRAAALSGPGTNPDDRVPSGRMGFIGFPISAYLFAPIGHLEPRWALLAFKIQSAVFLALGLFLLYPSFRAATRDRFREEVALAVYLLIAFVYAPFWFIFDVGGQATALNLFLLVLFHRSFVNGRPAGAALALSLGVLVKPFFALVLPVLAVGRDRRVVGWAAAYLFAAGVASVLLLGWPVNREWLLVMRDASGGLAEPWWNNSSMFSSIYTFWAGSQNHDLAPAGEPHGAAAALIAALKAVILFVFFALARRTEVADLDPAARRHHVAGMAIVFALCFSSIVWPHYLAFLFVPLLFWLFPLTPLPRRAEMLAWAIFFSTFAVQSRFVQRAVIMRLDDHPYAQTLLAGLIAGITMLLTLTLITVWNRQIRQSMSLRRAAVLPGAAAEPRP